MAVHACLVPRPTTSPVPDQLIVTVEAWSQAEALDRPVEPRDTEKRSLIAPYADSCEVVRTRHQESGTAPD
jgi:hypothetical protein